MKQSILTIIYRDVEKKPKQIADLRCFCYSYILYKENTQKPFVKTYFSLKIILIITMHPKLYFFLIVGINSLIISLYTWIYLIV